MNQLSVTAKAFVALTVLAGAAALIHALIHWQLADPLQFVVLLVVAVAASRLKIKLPGVNGSMSLNLPFFLIVAARLSISEALVITFVSSLAQSISRSGNKPVRIAFNTATLTGAVWLAATAFTAASQQHFALPVAIAAAGAAYFLGNTVPVALVLRLAENAPLAQTWSRIAGLTYPYYLLSASLAATVCGGFRSIGWTIPLVLLVAMYLTYRSYRLYFAQSAGKSRSKAAGAES